MAPLDDILQELKSKTNLNEEEISEKIKEKQDSLSGLVSEDGAAYLVAKEMGVNLFGSEKRKLDIKNIMAGMRSVSVAGRVFKLSKIIDFKKKNGDSGRVVNLFIGDHTGYVRMPLWNDRVRLVEDGSVSIGDVVQISGAYSQKNIYGDIELSLGKYGKIFKITEEAVGSDIRFPTVEELNKNFQGPRNNRVSIKDIEPGNSEIKATIIDVAKSNFIFKVCPKCGKKVNRNGDKYECGEHGEVEYKPAMVFPFIVDDGTGILRIVAFRDVAEELVSISVDDIDSMSPDERYEKLIGNVVGKEYIIYGRVKMNKRYNRLEMIANRVKSLNISKETEQLSSLLNMKLS